MTAPPQNRATMWLWIIGLALLLPALRGFVQGFFSLELPEQPTALTLAISGGVIGWLIWRARSRRKDSPSP